MLYDVQEVNSKPKMNRISKDKRIQIIRCLVEGNSIRGTARLCEVVKNSVTRLLCEVGEACSAY